VVLHPSVFIHKLQSVQQHYELHENEEVLQSDLLKRQTVKFIFQHNFQIYSFKHLSMLHLVDFVHHTVVCPHMLWLS